MKKFLSALFLISAGVVMLACSSLSTATTTTNGTTTTVAELLADEQDVYAVQAVSAAELLVSFQDGAALVSQPLSLIDQAQVSLLDETTESEEETIVTEEVDVLDQYLSMMEQFLGDDNGLSVTVVESDLPEYAVKVIYTTRSLLGTDVTYTLYYNEILYEEPIEDPVDDPTTTTTTTTTEETTTSEEVTTSEETTTTEPETTVSEETTETSPLSFQGPEREREFEFEDENDDEVLYSLSGILIVGDLTYNLEGKKVLEEGEEVLSLRAYIDHDNYVKVRYQTDLDDGEQKFFFEVKTDGIIVNKSKVKVQTDPEDGKLQVKLEFVEGDASGKYQFKQYVEGNITTIKVKYEVESAEGVQEDGMIHITATYDELTGLTTYEYVLQPEEGQQGKTIEKHHQDHHGDHGNFDDNGNDDDHGPEDQPGNPNDADDDDDSEDGVTTATGDDVING